MEFTTEAKRKAHPQAGLIPLSMWQEPDLFNKSTSVWYSGDLLELMTARAQAIKGLLENMRFHTGLGAQWKYKGNAFLAIALSHPSLNYDELIEISQLLEISDKHLFRMACMLGNMDFFLKLASEYTSTAFH